MDTLPRPLGSAGMQSREAGKEQSKPVHPRYSSLPPGRAACRSVKGPSNPAQGWCCACDTLRRLDWSRAHPLLVQAAFPGLHARIAARQGTKALPRPFSSLALSFVSGVGPGQQTPSEGLSSQSLVLSPGPSAPKSSKAEKQLPFEECVGKAIGFRSLRSRISVCCGLGPCSS